MPACDTAVPGAHAPLLSGGDSGSGLDADSWRAMRGVLSSPGLRSAHTASPWVPHAQAPSSPPGAHLRKRRGASHASCQVPHQTVLAGNNAMSVCNNSRSSHLSGICSMAGVNPRGALSAAGLGPAHVMAEPKAAGLVHAAAVPAFAGVQSSGDGGAACAPAVQKACAGQPCFAEHMRSLW